MSLKLNTKYLEGFVSEHEYEGMAAQVTAAHNTLVNRNGLGNDFLGWVTLPEDYDKEEFARRIADNTLLEVTNAVPVKKGDVFFIKSGTLHAIGKGILIAEIQQNSNTTYRIYDYGRVGNDGKPRELHVNKALDVTKLAPAEQYPETPVEKKDGYDIKLLSKCEYFTTYRVNVETKAELDADENSFNSILVLEGEPVISGGETVSAKKGESVFISAGTGKYTVEGKCTFVLTKID